MIIYSLLCIHKGVSKNRLLSVLCGAEVVYFGVFDRYWRKFFDFIHITKGST